MRDFGRAELIEPEAIGEPGKRTFRLRVMSGGDAASLWLEKEQLAALTLAIHQLLDQTGEPATEDDSGEPGAGSFPALAEVDFKIGRLGIGYDEGQRMVAIFAYTVEEAEDNSQPAFACKISRKQCRTFAQRAEEAINAGRPVCVLCGVPLEGGAHKCLRRNGHSDHPISLDDDDD